MLLEFWDPMIDLDRVKSVWGSWSNWNVGIWLDVSEHVVFQLLRFGYIDDLRIRVWEWSLFDLSYW